MNLKKNKKLMKWCSLGIIILFIGNSAIFGGSIENNDKKTNIKYTYSDEITDLDCYGFIIPLPSGNDSTSETFLNTKVRNLVNDLLREDIDIYWSADNFSIHSKKLNSDIISDNFFEKGDFIAPFCGEKHKDTLTTAIIYDYFFDCEIDDDVLKVEVYEILEPLDIDAYKLVEPRIAQHLGTPTRYSWPCFLQIADAGGFFTMEFLLDDETESFLNNKDFNVFMWPYKPNPARYYEMMKTLSNVKGSNAIRNFVRNGGGYIGTCYGAIVASSGSLSPIPIFSLRHAYNPYLSSIPFFDIAISDNLMRPFLDKENLYITTGEIVNINHPLSFGINSTVKEFFNGAWFQYLGRKSSAVGFHRSLTNSNDNGDVPYWLENSVADTPSWVTSTFGDGKIVQYSSHPEFVNNISLLFNTIDWDGDPYYGRRTIHNALFYTTSEEINKIYISKSYQLSFIESFGEKTVNLFIEEINSTVFEDDRIRIDFLKDKISLLKNIADESKELYLHQNEITSADEISRLIGYTSHFCNIFSEYYNKTLTSLEILEWVYPLLFEFDELVLKRMNDLKINISLRLNNSEEIVSETITIAKNLKNYLENKSSIIFYNIGLTRTSRLMLNTYETGLKYIPQTYFEVIKLARSSWYNYEAKKALEITQNAEMMNNKNIETISID